MSSDLPQNILDMVVMTPIESLIQTVLSPRLAPIRVQTLIEPDQSAPFVLIRGTNDGDGDGRFTDSAIIDVEVFTIGTNADEDASLLAEAVRVALIDAWMTQEVTPYGHITWVDRRQRPHRAPDWATSTGPVQYADLPTGFVRYETTFSIDIRRPYVNPYAA